MKYKQFKAGFLSIFGITEFAKNEEGKYYLTDTEKAELKASGQSDEFIAGFESALENDFKDEEQSSPEKEKAESTAVMKGLIADYTTKLSVAYSEKDALTKEKGQLSTEVAAKQKTIDDLNAKIQLLVDNPETDPGKGAQQGQSNNKDMKVDYKNEEQLGGFNGERFAMDRPYNQRARAAMLYQQGIQATAAVESSVDYGRLKEDLGDFYRIPWQERLQSFLRELQTIERIFPCEYGYQDRAVLTNIFLGEFSQADNTASDFDNVVKGSYEFDPEELRMFDVMFAHKFRDLKALEKTWIGYLNQEGSQVIKWSFIEFILFETAKKLHNERELRRINGRRKNPKLDEPGTAMGAADGFYEFIRRKVDGWQTDGGKTYYQIQPFVLGAITQGNIGEALYKGTSMIPAVIRDSGALVCYIPALMKTWYDKWQETNFGTNTDYTTAAKHAYIKEYPNVRVEIIPNADNHGRIVWSLDGNFKTFGHVQGEMTRFSLEQQDWTLKVWSNWKESTWARMVGFRYDKKADMDGSRQMIWCNEFDYSPDYYVPAEKDNATPSVSIHSSIETVANKALLSITDIVDAKVGKEIRVKSGSDDQGVQILKAGKFSLLTAAWNPKKGEVIKLMKRADGKFIELGRETAALGALQFDANDATPSVDGATEFITGNNTAATAITDIEDAIDGKVYTIYGNGSANASTIANSGNFSLTAAITLDAGKYIKLVKSGTTFYEVERG